MNTVVIIFLGFIAGSVVSGIAVIGRRLSKITEQLDDITKILKSK